MAHRNRSLQKRLDRAFDDLWNPGYPFSEEMEFLPPVDVEENDKNYLVSFDLPGVKKEEVKIEIKDNLLTLSGERRQERKEEGKGRVSRERFHGSFFRSFALPANIDPNTIEARYENGVLEISIPKVAGTTPKQIPIKSTKAA